MGRLAPALVQPLIGRIYLPAGTPRDNLVAKFTTYSSAQVSVGGVTQQSASTANNFSQPLTYVVTSSGYSVNNIVTVSNSNYYIFFTARNNITGDLIDVANNISPSPSPQVTTGSAAADYLCSQDSNNPATNPAKSSYKALIIDGTNRNLTTNWVIQKGTRHSAPGIIKIRLI